MTDVAETKNRANFFMPLWQISLKEFRAYFNSYMAVSILPLVLIIASLLGYFFIKKYPVSSKTLQHIFWALSGTTMFVSVLISMRLFAEEKAFGTIELLITSPITESQMVIGKFISAVMFLCVWILITIPIPTFVMIYGDGHWGQIFSGYIGVFLLGSTVIAVTTFYSTTTSMQIIAGALGGANVVLFLLMGFFSPYISYPLKKLVREFSFYVHYMDFEKGVIVMRHLVFFFSIIIFYLYLSVVSLQSRKWK